MKPVADEVGPVSRRYASSPETGLEEIIGDFLEADFWPGKVSGLRVIQRTCGY
jgi:hypothetical protein